MEGKIDRFEERQMEGWIDVMIDRWKKKQTMEGKIDRLEERQMEGWIDRLEER